MRLSRKAIFLKYVTLLVYDRYVNESVTESISCLYTAHCREKLLNSIVSNWFFCFC